MDWIVVCALSLRFCSFFLNNRRVIFPSLFYQQKLSKYIDLMDLNEQYRLIAYLNLLINIFIIFIHVPLPSFPRILVEFTNFQANLKNVHWIRVCLLSTLT